MTSTNFIQKNQFENNKEVLAQKTSEINKIYDYEAFLSEQANIQKQQMQEKKAAAALARQAKQAEQKKEKTGSKKLQENVDPNNRPLTVYQKKKLKTLLIMAEKQAVKVIKMMEKSYKDDCYLMKEKKPAIKKLQVIPQIQKDLKHRLIQECFLNMNGLDLLAKWLIPSSSSAKPSKIMLQKVFYILRSLSYIGPVHLKTSIIGQYVMHLYRKADDQEIQNQAKQIIDAWTRIVTNNKINYSHNSQKMKSINDEPSSSQIQITQESLKQNEMQEENKEIEIVTEKNIVEKDDEPEHNIDMHEKQDLLELEQELNPTVKQLQILKPATNPNEYSDKTKSILKNLYNLTKRQKKNSYLR